ncbi:MAG: SDR family oxidoreductase [SAR202 cluster bacterium]|nr:SDR family oxidoreductase [SAR202 cluster bacterium]MQG71259.1 SDR family oxidoreductase [SAR202 cluster bacterium]|tara:strand:- start:237 stop:1052 length:816 start_codon:yes stop_codon:yes gene_type:complete
MACATIAANQTRARSFQLTGRLEDKVAIVTGGASGIGRAICQRFGREGAKVVVADRNIAGAEETLSLMGASPDTASMVDVNISDSFQVERMVDAAVTQFGRLDILINGAAILIRTPPLVEVDEVLWDLTMETNVKGVFLCCKYAIPAMTANGGGSIVNISSMSGVRGVGYSVPYAVAKAGVIHLTTVAASQYTAQGVRINCIAPGGVDTPQMRGSTASAEAFAGRNEGHPMGRVGTADEIANLVLWLASDEASYVSGSTYIIDGGAWAGAQ